MQINRLKALMWLGECTGDDIWSLEHCRQRDVPQSWLEELSDCFESGFDSDRQTIYVEDQLVNQYHGIRDVDLAKHIGRTLGIAVTELEQRAASRAHLVRMIQEAAEEL